MRPWGKQKSSVLLLGLLILLSSLSQKTSVYAASSFFGLGDEPEISTPSLLLADDFRNDVLGTTPAAWNVAGSSHYLQVVPDPGISSGRAVGIRTDPGIVNTTMNAIMWDPPAADANRIAIEHKIKWFEGKNNLYINKSGNHMIHWWISNGGILQFNEGDGTGDRRTTRDIGPIQEGWNHIRMIADLDQQTVVFYLNDMSSPASEPLTFGRPIDSWDEIMISFSHTHNPDVPKDVYYADAKVWVVD